MIVFLTQVLKTSLDQNLYITFIDYCAGAKCDVYIFAHNLCIYRVFTCDATTVSLRSCLIVIIKAALLQMFESQEITYHIYM